MNEMLRIKDLDAMDNLLSKDCSRVSRRVFTSHEVYQLEQKRIFQRNWIYLAHESQLKKPGDFVTAWMGEVPVIVSRGADDNISACINSCTHRGLRVCRADQGNTGRFTCPYHNWSYNTDGELIGMPQASNVQHNIDKKALSLKKVPRIERVFGLIFGSLNPNIESLDEYLGDMRFYLEAFFERFPGGLEVVGVPHKWQLKSNWKLPVENQLGDIAHAPFLHASTVPPNSDNAKQLEMGSLTAVPKAGHGSALILMPEDTPGEALYTMDASAPKELKDFLIENHRTMSERITPVQARIKGLSLGVYPNLSLLWGQSTLRVSHPRAPGLIEYWSWWLTPVQAPDYIRTMLRSQYNFVFGPGGLLEQEDSYAWARQYEGSDISYMDDEPYYYGLGLNEEFSHPELPGTVGRAYNEHYARSFYQRWREDMLNEEN